MSKIIVLICLLPSIFAAPKNASHVQQIKNKKNVTNNAPNEDMWPSDYEAISLHANEQSTGESSTEDSPTTLISNLIEKGLSLNTELQNHTIVPRKSTEMADSDNPEYIDTRRLLGWLKKFLNIDKTPTVTSTTESLNEILDHDIPSIEEPVAVQKFLISAIINLTHAISKLTQILLKNDSEAATFSQIPQIPQNNIDQVQRLIKKSYIYTPITHARIRRDTSKAEIHEANASINNSVASNNVTTGNSLNTTTNASLIDSSPLQSNDVSSTNVSVSSDVALGKVKSTDSLPSANIPPTSKNVASSNDSTSTVTVKSNQPELSRRFEEKKKVQDSEIKKRMLSYAEDTFAEITKKLMPVKKIKSLHDKNELYKIGYVMANIDTLEANVQNLKKEVDSHKASWDDKTVLDLFDKLLVSNKIVTTLLESLNNLQNVALSQKHENKDKNQTTTRDHLDYVSWL